ncbi:MAG: hypothetical protein AABY22_18685 [Nanoarchaeota archaeon]
MTLKCSYTEEPLTTQSTWQGNELYICKDCSRELLKEIKYTWREESIKYEEKTDLPILKSPLTVVLDSLNEKFTI